MLYKYAILFLVIFQLAIHQGTAISLPSMSFHRHDPSRQTAEGDIPELADPTNSSTEGCTGDGWEPFKDEKCFKIIEVFATRAQAEELCANEVELGESAPGLVTPKYAAEQEFLTQWIFNLSTIESNVWIGASRVRLNETHHKFEWSADGSEFRFTNWAVDSPSNVTARECVQMKSSVSMVREAGLIADVSFDPTLDGKWADVTCAQGNVVVCQKYQRSSADVQRGILNNRRDIEELQKELGLPRAAAARGSRRRHEEH